MYCKDKHKKPEIIVCDILDSANEVECACLKDKGLVLYLKKNLWLHGRE